MASLMRMSAEEATVAGHPVVPAERVLRGNIAEEASFDAELRPFLEIELHAKVTGYLSNISVDAGDLVKENQVIATVDVPELQSEIEQATATLSRANAEVARSQANYEDAHLIATRMVAADKAKPNLIAQQDIDAVNLKDRAAAGATDAAKEQVRVAEAELQKLKIMDAYRKIVVPFNGVITKRYADPGALIQAGTNSGTVPVVRLSQNDLLRVFFPVSISYAAGVKVGDPVEIRISSPSRVIHGKVSRFSRKLETSTRTMDVQVDLPNPDLSLTPGMYAVAVLQTNVHHNTLSVPLLAIQRNRAGAAKVFVVGKDSKVEERPVELGLETPDRVEVTKGLQENEVVVVTGGVTVKAGDVVQAAIEPTNTASATPPQSEAN